MNQLLQVSLRQKAVFIPAQEFKTTEVALTESTGLLVANLAKLGYGVSETLLQALNKTTPSFKLKVLNMFREVMGIKKNWTPLVKAWDIPTGENFSDHVITFFANLFRAKGTALACGHIIPEGTFPLHRYNGCPYCGTPFEQGALTLYKQGSKEKVLELWTEKESIAFLEDLLTSKTALDATQMDSLKILLSEYEIPTQVKVGMKETMIAVVEVLIEQGQWQKAQALFTTPTDILRYLWYKHTGLLQIIEPKTLIRRQAKNNKHIHQAQDHSAKAKLYTKATLKLKYSRKEGVMVAGWLNALPLDVYQASENMHAKRGMWVRFIRALRLAEYSKGARFGKLKELMDVFYNQQYDVWQAHVNHYRLRYDAASTFTLLQERPGLFARSLFANMLWFGADEAITAFEEIIDKVPARLVFTLAMYAEIYFEPNATRVVKPLGGVNKNIPANQFLSLYSWEDLQKMKEKVANLCILVMRKRFAALENNNTTMYIDPALFKMPVSIGDRSESVQDMPSALTGTRFPVQGNKVRLFMQWGEGLPAQHLDMDLSAVVTYDYKTDRCSFSQLTATGCKHSGDIRSIPHKIGTAEYIELDIPELQKAKARYVIFTCNAYTAGAITPNLVVGWMDSKYPMRISETSGVAYDPSCVQHQVRVVSNLAKGLAFGVLDVAANEIIWLEMSFDGQLAQNLDTQGVAALLKKLESKISIGQLLSIKAKAQGLELIDIPNADEIYTKEWAMNAAAVTKLLVD